MLFALAGPSGSGKSTLAERLCQSDAALTPLVSYTTRPKRLSDKQGELEYVSDALFTQMVASDLFLWNVQPYQSGYRYGTLTEDVDAALAHRDCVAVLTGEALPTLYGYARGIDALDEVIFIYLEITNQDELRRRFALDPTRTDVEQRLALASKEVAHAQASFVPYHFVDASRSPDEVFETVSAQLGFTTS